MLYIHGSSAVLNGNVNHYYYRKANWDGCFQNKNDLQIVGILAREKICCLIDFFLRLGIRPLSHSSVLVAQVL